MQRAFRGEGIDNLMTIKNDRAVPPGSPQGLSDAAELEEVLLAEDIRRPWLRLVPKQDRTAALELNQLETHIKETAPTQNPAMLDRALQARIGALLREAYSDVACAPVPDRFVSLLDALSDKDKSSE